MTDWYDRDLSRSVSNQTRGPRPQHSALCLATAAFLSRGIRQKQFLTNTNLVSYDSSETRRQVLSLDYKLAHTGLSARG
jgi:hypothetical protein